VEQKINIRLSFIALLAVVFVTAANLLVFYNLFRTQITNDLKMNARMLMETEVFQREYDSLGNDPEKLSSSTLNKLETGDVRLTWIAEDGTVLFDNDAGASGLANHLDRPEIQEAIAVLNACDCKVFRNWKTFKSLPRSQVSSEFQRFRAFYCLEMLRSSSQKERIWSML